MNDTLQDLMREATRLTREGRLAEATDAIQRALGSTRAMPQARHEPLGEVLDGCVLERREPGSFDSGSLTHASLTRGFKLYVPPGASDRPLPLVVMLHGCTQDPDDFAVGTGMNTRAAERGFFVLYPAQAPDANPQRCWNWFKHNHQQRGRGEPALIAAMTLATIEQHGIDRSRVFVAGLSAGGAMAALVAAAYPDLFAAAGVHSGLAPGAAASLPQALAAMRGAPPQGPAGATPLPLPTIVFHGDQDATVHPSNGEQTIGAALAGHASSAHTEQGASAGGRRYTRTQHRGADGRRVAEHWVVHGAGHAWSGGQPAGSFTDAAGPDATREMLRFFFEHPRDGGR